MKTFKIGDRVVSKKHPERGEGVVRGFRSVDVLVQHLGWTEGHNGGVLGLDLGRSGWCYVSSDLKKITKTRGIKVGDRVVTPKGVGKIIHIYTDNEPMFLVEHDKEVVGGHGGDGRGKPKHCYLYSLDDLTKILDNKQKHTFSENAVHILSRYDEDDNCYILEVFKDRKEGEKKKKLYEKQFPLYSYSLLGFEIQ